MTRWKIKSLPLNLMILSLIFLGPQYNMAEATVFPSAGEVQPLDVGTSAPGGILKTGSGAPFDLTAAIQARPTVLVFYRGSW